ncbi:MAG: flagellar motor switch protein FliG [Rubellimicrobium sp.]|nr:flagellar motor switch protein FliG [Rubellimicrobium sp.]
MIVQLLIADGQKVALSRLPEEVQMNLARELAGLRLVDRETLNAVAAEFADAIESVGLAAAGDVDTVLGALDGQLSQGALARLQREAALARGIDPWARLAALPPSELAAMMQREGVEIAAVALSKLPARHAAETLTHLPGERARRITYAMQETAAIRPEAVARIGRALAAVYADDTDPAFAARPEARVGAILNSTRPATREQVLDSLDRTDAAFAGQVRREIFTFANLHDRIRAADIPRAVKGIDNADMIAALGHALACGGGEERAATFILANISQRLAATLRDEIADRGPVPRRDGERAQDAIITTIRDRIDSGEIAFVTPDEDEAT